MPHLRFYSAIEFFAVIENLLSVEFGFKNIPNKKYHCLILSKQLLEWHPLHQQSMDIHITQISSLSSVDLINLHLRATKAETHHIKMPCVLPDLLPYEMDLKPRWYQSRPLSTVGISHANIQADLAVSRDEMWYTHQIDPADT